MTRSNDILELERRVEFLESAVLELNQGLRFPSLVSGPTPTRVIEVKVSYKQRIKYLIFCSRSSQAYDWSMTHPEISSLDWIRVQGDEWTFLANLFVMETHRLTAVLIGDPKSWEEKLEQFYIHLQQDGMIAEVLVFP